MKKTLTFFSLGTITAGALTYSIAHSALHDDYKDFAKASNFKTINADEALANHEAYIPLKYNNYREQKLSMFPGENLIPIKGKHRMNQFGEFKLYENVESHSTSSLGTVFTDHIVTSTVLQNDIYTIFLEGNYKKIFGTNKEAINFFDSCLSNVIASRSMIHNKNIMLSFVNNKQAKAISGNAGGDIITLNVNSTDAPSKVKDRIYYVLAHELMHVETESAGFSGDIRNDSDMGVTNAENTIKSMTNYANLTHRPKLIDLAKKLVHNPSMMPTINNVYLGNIPNSPYKTLSGIFDSEITHLYTFPFETIVEDLLSMSLGASHSTQYNSHINGVVGSIGFRVSHGVSLLDVKDRLNVNKKILESTINSLGFNSQRIENNPQTWAIANQLFNRIRVGFYTKKPIKITKPIKIVNGKESIELKLKSYKTNSYMRLSPFADEALNYNVYYHQIIIPETFTKNVADLAKMEFQYQYTAGDFGDLVLKEAFRITDNLNEAGSIKLPVVIKNKPFAPPLIQAPPAPGGSHV